MRFTGNAAQILFLHWRLFISKTCLDGTTGAANGEEQVEVFPRLHKLSILNCSRVLGRLLYYLPSLKELVICESKCLSVSISSFPMLRNLDVDGCKELIYRSTTQFSSLNSVVLSCISNFSFLT